MIIYFVDNSITALYATIGILQILNPDRWKNHYRSFSIAVVCTVIAQCHPEKNTTVTKLTRKLSTS